MLNPNSSALDVIFLMFINVYMYFHIILRNLYLRKSVLHTGCLRKKYGEADYRYLRMVTHNNLIFSDMQLQPHVCQTLFKL